MSGGLLGDFYARLKELKCVPCERCGGSYMAPDHIEHRTILDAFVFEKTPGVPHDETEVMPGTVVNAVPDAAA